MVDKALPKSRFNHPFSVSSMVHIPPLSVGCSQTMLCVSHMSAYPVIAVSLKQNGFGAVIFRASPQHYEMIFMDDRKYSRLNAIVWIHLPGIWWNYQGDGLVTDNTGWLTDKAVKLGYKPGGSTSDIQNISMKWYTNFSVWYIDDMVQSSIPGMSCCISPTAMKTGYPLNVIQYERYMSQCGEKWSKHIPKCITVIHRCCAWYHRIQ